MIGDNISLLNFAVLLTMHGLAMVKLAATPMNTGLCWAEPKRKLLYLA
jgi:heme/copper-type cytochrome/quinol oxidase subunit 1